jgi:methylase of polypeptide subunit release factors
MRSCKMCRRSATSEDAREHENADPILRNKVGKPFEATWADADYIIGNPPFLGEKNLRRELGDKYVEDLFVCSKSADRS